MIVSRHRLDGLLRVAPLTTGVAAVLMFALSPVAVAQPVAQGPELAAGTQADESLQFLQRTRAVSRAADGSFVVVWTRAAGGGLRTGIFAQRYDSQGNAIGTELPVSAEELFSNDPDSHAPAVAHTQGGEVVIVWRGRDPDDTQSDYQVRGRLVDAGGDLVGTEFRVNETVPGNYHGGRGPDVAAMDNGSFVVVWDSAYSGGNYTKQIFGQRMAADGSKIGTEFMVNTVDTGYSYDPQVATRGDGSFVVVWARRPTSGYGFNGAEVYGQRFASSGAQAGTEFRVNSFLTYPENQPDIAVRNDGSFVVVWHTVYGDDETFDDSISMQRFDSAGSPVGEEEHINTYVTGIQRSPSVAMNDNGTFVVVWESLSAYSGADNRDDGVGIFGLCFNANGVNPGSDFHVNSYTSGREHYPSIATDGVGNFVMAWERGENYYGGVDSDAYLRRFSIPGCEGGSATTTTTLPPPADLSIEKTDDTHYWADDPTIDYRLTVTKTAQPTNDVTITERVPERTTFSAADSTAGWQCTPDAGAGSLCTMVLAAMAAGEQREVTFAVTVDEGTPQSWIVYNQAFVSEGASVVARRGELEAAHDPRRPIAKADEEMGSDDDTTGPFNCSFAPFSPPCDLCCHIFSYFFVGEEGGCWGAGEVLKTASAAVGTIARTVTSVDDFSTMFRIRDRVLPDSRGGERFIDLYYEHGPAMTAAGSGDAQIFADAGQALDELMPNFDALDAGTGAGSIVTQAAVDAMNAFLDRLAASAAPDLAAAIARERTRLGLDDWAGLSADEALARLDMLTCAGFEDTFYCGEVSGDCRISATDALIVLNIAVRSEAERPESDLDGNGSTSATDALITLNIAVGLLPETNECNLS